MLWRVALGSVLVVCAVPVVRGFADGAPVEACIFKGPNHPATKSQPPDTLPHDFVAESGSYKGKDKIAGTSMFNYCR